MRKAGDFVKGNSGLTPKQSRFIAEYLLDLDIGAASSRSGYKVVQGRNLLKLPRIKEIISRALKAREYRTAVKADDVVRELANIAFSDPGELMDFSDKVPKMRDACDIPEHARRAISSVVLKRYPDQGETVEIVEYKLWDKMKALSDLAKHTGVVPISKNPPTNSTVNININQIQMEKLKELSVEELEILIGLQRRVADKLQSLPALPAPQPDFVLEGKIVPIKEENEEDEDN